MTPVPPPPLVSARRIGLPRRVDCSVLARHRRWILSADRDRDLQEQLVRPSLLNEEIVVKIPNRPGDVERIGEDLISLRSAAVRCNVQRNPPVSSPDAIERANPGWYEPSSRAARAARKGHARRLVACFGHRFEHTSPWNRPTRSRALSCPRVMPGRATAGQGANAHATGHDWKSQLAIATPVEGLKSVAHTGARVRILS